MSSRMEWIYNDWVSSERQMALRSAPDFDFIANRILEDMKIKDFKVCRGKDVELRGCRRPEFRIEVTPDTFDLFFNSPQGYRGQYHQSPKKGERANNDILSRMSKRLIAGACRKNTEPTMDAAAIKKSLQARSAKIWIDEKDARAQPTDIGLVKDLLVEPWLGTAKAYVNDPGRYPDSNKEVKAVDGVKAPTGTILEVKGAFLDSNDEEQVARDKIERSQHIHLYGFS